MSNHTSNGPERMRAAAASLPTTFEAGFRQGRELSAPADPSSPLVVAVGMGGSAIAADLARGVIEAETPAALIVNRSSELPRAAGPNSHVVLVSYSGNTWETLHSYEAAGRVGAHRTVVSSGGLLAERATRDGVPLLVLPSDIPQPRSAVGHMLGAILGLLDPWFPESNEGRVARVARQTEAAISVYVRPRGPAARLAEKIGNRLPFVYAESTFLALARRWKTQFEENAKRLAVFDEVPELFHNAIVGWDATRKAEAARYAPLFLEWSGEAPPIRASLSYLERLLRSRGATPLKVTLDSDDRLVALVRGIALGDYVSLFLADQRKVDPFPVEAIRRLKAAIGNPANPGRRAPSRSGRGKP